MGEQLQTSPFYQADGADATAVQATLTGLAASLASIEAAATALRAGTITPAQRDSLLADMLLTYRQILLLILGRAS